MVFYWIFTKITISGGSIQYYLATANDCHEDYVKYLLDKKTLSIKRINHVLTGILKEEKFTFNQRLIDELYTNYHHFTSFKQKIRTNISKNGVIISPKTNQERKCLHGKIIPKIRSN